MTDFKRFSLRVPAVLHSYLEEKSKRTGISMNAIVILMLENQIMQETVAPHIPKMIEEYEKTKGGE